MPESYVPVCSVIMLGCKALDNVPPVPGACPVCGPGVIPGHDNRYCSKCDSVSPAKQYHISKSLRAERIGVDLKTRAEVAEDKARMKLRAFINQRRSLTEVERRRMWNGYRGGIVRELVDDLTNVAKTCRNWLQEIGQEPNWSSVLDHHGNVIGKRDPGITS